MEYKIELLKLGKTQRDLIKGLASRGIITNPPEMSTALSGVARPKFDDIRKASEEIIAEWKSEAENND